jgi:hypothetical protein
MDQFGVGLEGIITDGASGDKGRVWFCLSVVLQRENGRKAKRPAKWFVFSIATRLHWSAAFSIETWELEITGESGFYAPPLGWNALLSTTKTNRPKGKNSEQPAAAAADAPAGIRDPRISSSCTQLQPVEKWYCCCSIDQDVLAHHQSGLVVHHDCIHYIKLLNLWGFKLIVIDKK